jgi:hypothetical protein
MKNKVNLSCLEYKIYLKKIRIESTINFLIKHINLILQYQKYNQYFNYKLLF